MEYHQWWQRLLLGTMLRESRPPLEDKELAYVALGTLSYADNTQAITAEALAFQRHTPATKEWPRAIEQEVSYKKSCCSRQLEAKSQQCCYGARRSPPPAKSARQARHRHRRGASVGDNVDQVPWGRMWCAPTLLHLPTFMASANTTPITRRSFHRAAITLMSDKELSGIQWCSGHCRGTQLSRAKEVVFSVLAPAFPKSRAPR